MNQISEAAVLDALKAIIDPDLKKDIVTLGFIHNLEISGGNVAFTIMLTTPACPVKEQMEAQATEIVRGLEGVTSVNVKMDAEVPQGRGIANNVAIEGVKNIIAVSSGKGGVGKSTVAASLAFSLKQRGHAVGLMDADVYGPSIPHIVGLTGEQPTVAEGRYQPPSVQGIKTMSMGFLVAPEQAVVWRGPMLHKAVRDFLYLVNWGSLDYLIVDLPPGTGDIVLSLSQQMPITGGVIVCTPQDVALLDARKALNMFRTVKIPCRGVVENMSFFECPKCNERTEIFGNGGAQRWAKEENIPFLGSIPINLQIRLNGDGGKTGDNVEAKSPVKNCFSEIADRLIAGIEADGNPTMPVIEIVD